MAYENLELIKVFEGTYSSFENTISDNKNKLVLVTGDSNADALALRDAYIYAIDSEGNYKKIRVPKYYLSAIRYQKEGMTDTSLYAGVVQFIEGEGIGVSVSDKGAIKIDAQAAIDDVRGKEEDDEELATIYGVKKKIANLIGDKDSTSNDKTIYGVYYYARAAALSAQSNSKVTMDGPTTNPNDGSRTYTLTQGEIEAERRQIGTITIPKASVLATEGSGVVSGTWGDDGIFSEDTDGKDKALKLVFESGEASYINLELIANIYTPESGAKEIQIAINENNVVSATIVAKSVSTNKIADKAVTMDKLGADEQKALALANTSIQGVSSGNTEYISVTSKKDGYVTNLFSKEITAKTATITSETATGDGLATVADIRAYLAARLSVKIVS